MHGCRSVGLVVPVEAAAQAANHGVLRFRRREVQVAAAERDRKGVPLRLAQLGPGPG